MERANEIEDLQRALAEATARRAAILAEVQELFARLPDIKAAFGNPFFFSHPENADESIENYTGPSSHKVALPTILALRRIEDEIRHTKEQLRGLGVAVDPVS